MLISLLTLTAISTTVQATTVGRTAGQYNVSPFGSAQYTIPIWAPPGPRGVQPNLALSYDSQSGIGPLGVGWSLSGLGSITRCNLTVAQDTTPAPVALVTSDGYCLNGNRLRLTGGTYGTAGSTYQTEIADFSNITANGTAGNGPQYFTVQERNGLTLYFGYTDGNGNGANSEVLASGSSTALTWLLSKVVDRAGNNYVVNYTALTGTAVPATILWTPASAGSSSYTYTMQFNYSANAPQSSINAYVAGTLVSNTELLSSIEILVGSTVVKDYSLSYQTSPLTGREELMSVNECADSAQSNCLEPTSVSYQGGSPGLSTTSNTALNTSGSGLSARYDLNGDGYPDIVYTSGGASYVAFGSASGYGTPVNVGAIAQVIGNLTGGAEDGILAQKSGAWWYYTWNGSGFTGTSTGLAVDTATQWQLADVDGDGKPDLVGLYVVTVVKNGLQHTTTYVKFYLNNSTGTTPSFSSTLNVGATVTNGAELFTPDFQYGKLRRFDFNGDGRDDLVIVYGVAGNPATIYTDELISTGSAFTVMQASTQSGSTYTPVFFTNWNDDKCTDLVAGNTLAVSGCNGTVPQTYAINGTLVGAMDWDGDGRTDLIVANGSTLGVYLSKATGTPTLTSTSISYASTCQYVWMDANGDGLDDLGCWSQTGSGGVTYYLHNGTSDLATKFADGYGNSASPAYVSIASSNYQQYSDATFPDQNYIGPLYVVSETVFSDASAAPGATFNQQFYYSDAWMNLQGRGFEGFGIIRTYDSRNGLYDYQYYERAFPYTGMKYQETVADGSFNPAQSTGITALTTLSSTTNQQRYFPYFSNWTSTQREVGGTENSDLITTKSTNYTFDNYGNATNIVATVTDNDPGSPYNGYSWTTDTINTTDISVNQSADLAQWCLNMLDETQVVYSSTLSGSTSVTRTKTFTPDTPANCRISSAVTEPTANGGLYKVTEALTFDSFGNISTDVVSGANMPSSPATRQTTLNWGTTGQFLNTATDPSGATTTWTYSSEQSLAFGVPDSVLDANAVKTSWTYDAFGRKSKETRPDATYTTWAWNACTSFCGWSNSVYQIAQTEDGPNGATIRTDTTSFDSVDRMTQTAGPTVSGAIATVQMLYNSMGMLVQKSMPFLGGATAYQQSFGYDVLNRLVETERPVNAASGPTYCNPATVPPTSGCQGTSYAYAGRTVKMTDPLGHTKTTVTDVNGWLRKTTDALGFYVTKAYDSAGSLLGVTDSVGNTLLKNVTYNYGIKPFLVAATDADRGAWTYTVDSLGERIGWTDAKGASTSMTYDSLSRPLSRAEAGGSFVSQWAWGSTPASHNVGQLIYECTQNNSSTCTSPVYSESRTFDYIGRLSARAITEAENPGNDTGGVFQFSYSYTEGAGLGGLRNITYPKSTSGFALSITYSYQYGLLKSITDEADTTATCGSTCVLWTANSINGFGQITEETLGNGVVTNRSYDPVTSWLSGATAGVGGGAALLNQSYLEDKNGSIIQRQNNTLGLTESFAYDADNRLTCTALASTCTTPTVVYDGGVAGPGNITSQAGVGTYSYPAPGQPQPHAVTSLTGTFNGVVNPTFSYDANGNMTSRAGSTVSWQPYNYPHSIYAADATGAESVTFAYGPDRQRWKQTYNGPTTTEFTYFVGGLMDVVYNSGTTDYRHYIYAGGEPIAVYSRTTAGVNTMSYMLADHQGSVSAISSNAGTSDVNESFTAFGARRNPTTWSGAPSTADLNTIAGLSRQGYTFQTWLGQSMGLNHMNGRVQDAILGRFLSPDPHVPDPSSAQSYNRYSYADNNPVSFRDPTGFKKVGTCGTDWCPGPNARSGPWAFSGLGNSGDGGLAWIQGNNITGGNDFGPGGIYAPYVNPGNASPGNDDGAAAGAGAADGGVSGTSGSGGDTGSGAAQSQAPTQTGSSGDQLQQITVTAQNQSQGQGPDLGVTPFAGLSEIVVMSSPIRPTQINMTQWSYLKIATQHLWFSFPNTSQFLPIYNSYTGLFGLAGTIWGRGANSATLAPNGNWLVTANIGQPVGTDQSGAITNYGTLVVAPNLMSPNEGDVISMYPGLP
jgi:RHS repeat-associated protein